MSDITIRQLLEAGCHFGHQTRYWCPRMAPYIFGERNKLHIIDLQQTQPMLKEALNYLGSVVAQGGKVLFVGTKRQASRLIKEEAIRCNSPYVNFRWLGGMLTNYKTIRKSVKRLKDLDVMFENGAVDKLQKKEILKINREREKLEKSLSGIKEMGGLPDVLFVIDREFDYIAVNEANKLGIPVVSVVDSNCSPVGIDYVIPGNDDAIRSIRLYLSAAADAINDSRLEALTAQAEAMHAEAEESAADTDQAIIDAIKAEEAPAPVTDKESPESAAIAAPAPAVAAETTAAAEEAPVVVVKKKVAKKKVVVKKAAAPNETKAAETKPAEAKPAKAKPVEAKAKETKVKEIKVDKAEEGDKLTDINGIGPVIEGKLKAMGITTFKQISDFSPERCAEIDESLSFKGRIEREEWIAQAKKLA